MPALRMPREEATQLADAFESFYLDPRIPADPFSGRPASDSDVTEGEALRDARVPRLSHSRSLRRLCRAAVHGHRQETEERMGVHLAEGTAALERDVRCPDYG